MWIILIGIVKRKTDWEQQKTREDHVNKLFAWMKICMPPDRMIGGILFLSCLFVCLSVCLLSTLNFAITIET